MQESNFHKKKASVSCTIIYLFLKIFLNPARRCLLRLSDCNSEIYQLFLVKLYTIWILLLFLLIWVTLRNNFSIIWSNILLQLRKFDRFSLLSFETIIFSTYNVEMFFHSFRISEINSDLLPKFSLLAFLKDLFNVNCERIENYWKPC